MFAGIDIASERHWLAHLDDTGQPVGKPVPITENRDGHGKLLGALGPAPVLVALAATGKVVPTWNCVAVQAQGPVESFDDPARLLDAVTRLTNLHGRPRGAAGEVGDAPAEFIASQLRGIVGVRMAITRIAGKRKMSQNRDAADRAGVEAGLAASDSASDRLAAALIPG